MPARRRRAGVASLVQPACTAAPLCCGAPAAPHVLVSLLASSRAPGTTATAFLWRPCTLSDRCCFVLQLCSSTCTQHRHKCASRQIADAKARLIDHCDVLQAFRGNAIAGATQPQHCTQRTYHSSAHERCSARRRPSRCRRGLDCPTYGAPRDPLARQRVPARVGRRRRECARARAVAV